MANHICLVDCKLESTPTGGRAHIMYAAEPSSAAGRYQWEQNAAIKREGRRAWRATGQGESRECRAWGERRRRTESEGATYVTYGLLGRRFSRELAELSQ